MTALPVRIITPVCFRTIGGHTVEEEKILDIQRHQFGKKTFKKASEHILNRWDKEKIKAKAILELIYIDINSKEFQFIKNILEKNTIR